MHPITTGLNNTSVFAHTAQTKASEPFDVWSLTKGGEPLNLKQLGNLCAGKEAFYCNENSVEEAKSYLLKILTHEKFSDFAQHVIGKELTSSVETILPYLRAFSENPDPEELLALCKKDSQGICYFPGGWRGANGQFVAVKVKYITDSVAHITIVNRGNGSQLHNRVDRRSHAHDLSSPTYKIDLRSDLAKDLFRRWKELLSPLAGQANLHELSFYGLLAIYAEPVQGPEDARRASKNQYKTASFAAAISAMFADIFHDHQLSIDDYRQFSLVLKLFSLLQESAHYCDSEENRIIFKEAIAQTKVRAAKLGPDLCNSQLIHSWCDELQTRVGSLQNSSLESASTGNALGVIEPIKPTLQLYQYIYPEKSTTTTRSSIFTFTRPKTATALIDQLTDFNSKNRAPTSYLALRTFFRAVYREEFLDTLSSDDATALIDALYTTASKIRDHKGRQGRQIIAELSLLALDMAARCSEKITSLKFGEHYTLQLPILKGHDAAFQDPAAVQNLQLIQKRFTNRAANKTTLFGAHIAFENSNEARYLLDHIITKPVVDQIVTSEEPRRSKSDIVKRYFVEGKCYQEPNLPKDAFINPLKNIFGLINIFVETAREKKDYTSTQTTYTYSGSILSQNQIDPAFKPKTRLLGTEFFNKRMTSAKELQDDLQNLVYAVRQDPDDLASKKVGVVYKSYMQNADEEELPEAIHRELATLEAGRELRCLNSLDWLLRVNNFDLLQKKAVRDRLETLLFGPESIVYAVSSSPDQTLESLMRLQRLYQQPETTGEVLEWCTSLMVRFYIHLQQAYKNKTTLLPLDTSDFLQKCTQEGPYLARARALSHLAKATPSQDEFVVDLARAAFYGISLVDPTWPLLLGYSFDDPQLAGRANTFCAKPERLTAVANELLGINESFTWNASPEDPTLVLGTSPTKKIDINLATGESSTSKGAVIDILPYLKKQNSFLHLVGTASSLPATVDTYNNAETIDGKFRFCLTTQDTTTFISNPSTLITIKAGNRVSNWAQLRESYNTTNDDLSALTHYHLKELLGHDDVDSWQLSDGRNLINTRLLIDRKNPVRAVLQTNSIAQRMKLVDGVWEEEDILFSLAERDNTSPLDQLIRNAFPHSSCGYGYLFDKGVCTKIAVPGLNISFSLCPDRTLWLYDGDRDYKLMTQRASIDLGGYSHCLTLAHVRHGKRKLLITPISFDGEKKLLTNRPLVADVDQDGITGDVATHLYLALIFRSQRNFVEAMNHLKKSRHNKVDGKLEQKITLQLIHQPIYTAAAVAFDLHFLHRSLEHHERFSDKSFTSGHEIDQIERHFKDKYRIYLRARSQFREGVDSIPDYLKVPDSILNNAVPSPLDSSLTKLQYIEKKAACIRRDYSFENPTTWWREALTKDTKVAKGEKINWEASQQRLASSSIADNFLELARCAVSKEPLKIARARAFLLVYINQYDINSHCYNELLFSLLLVMLQSPDRFVDATKAETVVDCVLQAGKRIDDKDTGCRLLQKPHLPEKPLPEPPTRPALITRGAIPAWNAVAVPAFNRWPTEDLYNTYFTEKKVFPYKESYWPAETWTADDSLEKKLIDTLNSAFKQLQARERSEHIPKTTTLALDLATRKERITAKLTELERSTCEILNRLKEATVAQFLTLRAAEQLGKLELADAVQALLYRSHELLLKKNPTLSKEELDTIYKQTIEYLGLEIELNQLLEIENGSKDPYRLGELLFRKREYDPGMFPEILVYARATGKEPTSNQTRILIKILTSLEENIDFKLPSHLLVEFAAGGGKTSLFVPILCMFLIRKGKIPCITNTADLYYQSQELLPAILQKAYSLDLELIDRTVNHQWSKVELELLLKQLNRWRNSKAILMKVSTWHSLNTASKLACFQWFKQNDYEARSRMDLIDKILAFFKEHGVLLEDECQASSDPHDVTIRSFEFREQLPAEHHELYLEVYKRAGDLEECIDYFKTYKPFIGLDWLEEYVRSPLNGPRPVQLIALEKIQPALADLCIVAKASVRLHMPYANTLTLGKEYGDSSNPSVMTAAPHYEGRPTDAHFSDVLLDSLLTCKKTFEQGVPERFLPDVVKGIRSEHEGALFKKEKTTFVEKALQKLLDDREFCIDKITDSELCKRLLPHTKNSWLIERFLKLHALAEIRFYGNSAKSTPAEMALGFDNTIRMSAVVGISEIYSILVESDPALFDTESVVEALVLLMQEKNSNAILMEDRSSPKAFFEEMAKKMPEEFESLRAFFDSGIFASYKAEELLDAALHVAQEKGLTRHGITWNEDKTIIIPSKNLDRSASHTIAAFPLRQTTGRDYPDLEFTARCCLFLHKSITHGELVQTAMRARKLLAPNGQTLFWAMMKQLGNIISPDSEKFIAEKSIRWSVKNTARSLRSKILERAYQGISAEIDHFGWAQVKKESPSRDEQLVHLCPAPSHRPWELYDTLRTTTSTAIGLHKYAEEQTAALNISFANLPQQAKRRIEQIIKQTATLIDSLHAEHEKGLKQVAFHHQHRHHIREQRALGADQITPFESYGQIDSLENVQQLMQQFQAFTVLGIDKAKLPTFYIPLADRLTPRKDWKNAIKYLSHMLIFQGDNEQWKFCALTEAGARFYVEDIKKFRKVGYHSLKAFVVAFGKTILNSTFAITKQECDYLLGSLLFGASTSLITTLNGRSFNPHDLVHTIKEYKWTPVEYQAFCKHIRAHLPEGDEFAPEKYEKELFAMQQFLD